jgi:hypothetical protein
VDELGLLTEQRKQGSFEPLPASAAGTNANPASTTADSDKKKNPQ